MTKQRPPVVMAPGKGRAYPMGPLEAVFKADGDETRGKYAISEWWLEPHTRGPGAHQHQEDDVFYVLEGTLSFFVGGAWLDAPKGSLVIAPANTPHDFENRSERRAGMLNISVPGGFEPEMSGIAAWFRARSSADARTASAPVERRMKKTTAAKKAPAKKAPAKAKSPSELIDERIRDLDDWRGELLGQLRALVKAADPEVVEEWKWRGVPVWSHGGILCTGETYKSVVKLTFFKGAALPDPAGLFNSSLEGNARRAIDFPEGARVNTKALTKLIRDAVALNTAKAKK